MSSVTIKIHTEGSKGMAYAGSPDAPDAAMTFSMAGPRLMIIDHTEVGETLRGKKVGRQLLDQLVAKARAEKLKILPLCPYARSVFDKDPDISDVRH